MPETPAASEEATAIMLGIFDALPRQQATISTPGPTPGPAVPIGQTPAQHARELRVSSAMETAVSTAFCGMAAVPFFVRVESTSGGAPQTMARALLRAPGLVPKLAGLALALPLAAVAWGGITAVRAGIDELQRANDIARKG